MSEENKENRINVDDLPQGEKDLTTEEAKEVQGGLSVTTSTIEANEATGARISKVIIDSNST
jgi:hypothetical protein